MFEMRRNDDGVFRLSGRLDASQADHAQEDFQALSGPLTLDFTDLEYISSAGIAVLVQTYKRLRESGHDMRLVNLTPRVRNVFTYAGLNRLFIIE